LPESVSGLVGNLIGEVEIAMVTKARSRRRKAVSRYRRAGQGGEMRIVLRQPFREDLEALIEDTSVFAAERGLDSIKVIQRPTQDVDGGWVATLECHNSIISWLKSRFGKGKEERIFREEEPEAYEEVLYERGMKEWREKELEEEKEEEERRIRGGERQYRQATRAKAAGRLAAGYKTIGETRGAGREAVGEEEEGEPEVREQRSRPAGRGWTEEVEGEGYWTRTPRGGKVPRATRTGLPSGAAERQVRISREEAYQAGLSDAELKIYLEERKQAKKEEEKDRREAARIRREQAVAEARRIALETRARAGLPITTGERFAAAFAPSRRKVTTTTTPTGATIKTEEAGEGALRGGIKGIAKGVTKTVEGVGRVSGRKLPSKVVRAPRGFYAPSPMPIVGPSRPSTGFALPTIDLSRLRGGYQGPSTGGDGLARLRMGLGLGMGTSLLTSPVPRELMPGAVLQAVRTNGDGPPNTTEGIANEAGITERDALRELKKFTRAGALVKVGTGKDATWRVRR